MFRGAQVLGFQIPASADSLRAASHRAADMIFEKLTGTPGAFSTRIAYVSVTRQGEKDLYRLFVADADGANPRMISESSQPLMSPGWSPDGRRLAYVSFEGSRSAIFVQELATGKRTEVSARPGINGAPAFSPDGRWLALTLSGQDGNLDIHVLNPATGQLRRLTKNPAIDTEAAWSADGKAIYFTSDRSGGPQVYMVPVDGSGGARRITFEGRYNARPRVTPDGASLAVVHNDQGNYRIALVDLETKSTPDSDRRTAGRIAESGAKRQHDHLRDPDRRSRHPGGGVYGWPYQSDTGGGGRRCPRAGVVPVSDLLRGW